MIKSKYGIGIIAVMLFLGLGYGAYTFYLGNPAPQDATIILKEDGREILRLDDYRSMADGIYPFRFLEGDGAIEIREGKVRMMEMDRRVCPKGICSDTGYTDSFYKPIVCLPNKLILTVEVPEGTERDILGG